MTCLKPVKTLALLKNSMGYILGEMMGLKCIQSLKVTESLSTTGSSDS